MPPGLGSYVRQLRLDAGLTQQQAADLAGMSVAALRDVEQGRITTPRSTTLRRLAEAMRLPAPDAEELIRCGQPGRFPSNDLWLQVLGPLALHTGEGPVEVPERQRMVLGGLALSANTPVSEERLIEMIWGSRPPTNVAQLLRRDAARLRRRIRAAGELTAAAGSYQLTVSFNQLDLLLFRRLAADARQAREAGDPNRACRRFGDALALWRGGPLADLGTLRHDPEVRGLAGEWEATVVEYAEIATRLGRHDEVLPLLRRLVEANPLHEAGSARLLAALAAAGQAGAGVEMFDRLRRRLAEEFGTDPGPEVRAARRTLAHAPRTPQSRIVARRQLPGDIAEFTGRVAELTWLQERVASGAAQPTAVTALSIAGPGGIGKTRLAVHFAHQLVADGRYPNLQLYVELGEADPVGVLGALLDLLGVDESQVPTDLAGRAALYRDRLASERALVLLDGATGEEQVRPLLPAGPGNLVVVTSRRPLAVDGLEVLSLEAYPPSDAERLLSRIAGPERVARDPVATTRLLALCDHLPQAVSLVARRLRARPTWRTADLADRLAQSPDRLRELAAGSDQLSATFDGSYRALAPAARQLLRQLVGHHDGELSGPVAASLTGLSLPRVRRLLDELADAALLTALTGDRYRIPALLREYVQGVRPPAGGGRAG
jgi:DNA-binding SARP family transcriptional activator/DNA-binding XRE family transcriptional regulator